MLPNRLSRTSSSKANASVSLDNNANPEYYLMTLSERLSEHIAACFPALWVQTFEPEDALSEMARMCREQHWQLAVWDLEQGLQLPGQEKQPNTNTDSNTDSNTDPLAAIRAIQGLASADSSAILAMVNFHRFLNSAEIVQAVARQIMLGKQNRTFLVVLSPVVQIPVELEREFLVLEHELPDRGQLETLARSIATEENELPEGAELTQIMDAAAGLTRHEAEGAYSLSLVRHGRITAESIWDLKSQTLKKNGLLTLHRGGERFADLGGLEAIKGFCLRAMRKQGQSDPLKRPKGILLLSPPGCGKSQLAKALGNETGRPTLILDVGTLMGSLVGSTEANVRQAISIIDSMAPAVCMIDECEKAFAGVAGSGQSDSGVTARMFGRFLSWMNDRTSDVFLVATCNDISKLPPEFGRSERFDAVWYVDLPGVRERRAIWNIYLAMFGLDPQQPKPVDADFTGAEIRSCCRLAALLDVPLVEAAQYVVPVARTASEAVSRLRGWANGRCLDADIGGIYHRRDAGGTKSGRKVQRGEPSSN